MAGVGIIIGVEAEADREIGLEGRASGGDVANAVVGHVKIELPIGGEVGDGDEDLTPFDRSREEAIADVPGEDAASDWAAYDEGIALVEQ